MCFGEKPSHRTLQLCVKDLVHTVLISTPAHRGRQGCTAGKLTGKEEELVVQVDLLAF